MFHGLAGKFSPGFMVFFAVMGSGHAMGLRGEIVKLRCSLV
jgi:hypothetical protein